MDEILASIKQVIARDSRGAGPGDRRASDARAGHAAIDEDDVLDLGASAELADGAVEPSPLIAADAVSAMRDSLQALATMAAPGAAPQIVRSGETSLEGLVRELLRPMLADWLDQHLPPMVERLVAAEIARIVGKKG